MFRSIAFGGGGVRGGLHVGAIAALESHRGTLLFPDGVYGSSIGAIVATAVAFNLNATQIKSMMDSHFHLSKILPPLKLESVLSLMYNKGIFTMTQFEDTVVEAFLSQGVDLRDKMIGDSPQKLHIFASNLTTTRPTILTGNVPLLTAIRCSCCLPFIFEPQNLYNHLYVDGGVCLHYLDSVVPADCLVLHISRTTKSLHPSNLDSLTILDYVGDIYEVSRRSSMGKNTLWFENNSIGILQELTPEMKEMLYTEGRSQTLAFLAKRGTEMS
jgi:hypothetical protein